MLHLKSSHEGENRGYFYRPPTKLWEINVSLMSVCPHGVPCDYYPWCIGSHCTGALPPKTCDTGTLRAPPDMGHGPLLVKSSDQDWRSVQTCSLEDFPSPASDTWFTWGPQELTSSGNWSNRFGQCKRVVHNLLECFLVVVNFMCPETISTKTLI